MAEYAVLDKKTGKVMNMVMSARALDEVQAIFLDGYEVKPVDEVPQQVLEAYHGWNHRT